MQWLCGVLTNKSGVTCYFTWCRPKFTLNAGQNRSVFLTLVNYNEYYTKSRLILHMPAMRHKRQHNNLSKHRFKPAFGSKLNLAFTKQFVVSGWKPGQLTFAELYFSASFDYPSKFIRSWSKGSMQFYSMRKLIDSNKTETKIGHVSRVLFSRLT